MPSSSRSRSLSRGELRRILIAALGLIVISSVLLAGLALPAVGTMSVLTRAGTATFNELPDNFAPTPPSEQSVLLASDGTEIARFYAENRIVVPISEISPWVQKAVVATEDRRFFDHRGVDLQGMARAAINNLVHRDTQGASTITQQYVKNTLIEIGLQQGDDEQIREARAHTLTRKIREAKYAVSVERKYSKKQILQGYLNIAPFGPSVYGVESAARHYFSTHAKDLNLEQAALLAGLTQSPSAYNPLEHPKAAATRYSHVVKKIYNEGFITHTQYKEALAKATPEGIASLLKPSTASQGCAAAGDAAYFCAYVVDEILNNKTFGKSLAQRRNLLLRGGLEIKTTLSASAQQQAQASIENQVPKNDRSNVKIALASIEPGTGRITALAQNTTYGSPTDDDPTATENSFAVDRDHGGGAGYQTGSSFKPMTLAAWFKAGKSAYASVGGRTSYNLSEFTSTCPEVATGNSTWTFSNAIRGTEKPSSVIYGTQKSLNTNYVAMAARLDLCDILHMSQAVGAVAGDGTLPSANKDEQWHPSDILGTGSVPPLSMANAFATWANDGKYCTPIAIDSIKDSSGKTRKVPSASCHQTVDTTVSRKVMKVLNMTYQDYGSSANIGRPAATKTGTSNDAANAWLVGTTPQLSTAVWVGHSEGLHSMEHLNIGGRYYSTVWGSTIPTTAWKNYMSQALANTEVKGFPDVDLNGEGAGTVKGDSRDTSTSKRSRTTRQNRQQPARTQPQTTVTRQYYHYTGEDEQTYYYYEDH